MRTSFSSLGIALQADIPVIIPCFNAVTYARRMIEQLRGRGMRHLILVDNASTYPPMRDFLADPGAGVTVIAQAENKGPRDVLLDPVSFALLPQYFCLTDPDLVFDPAMPADFVAQLAALTNELAIGKAGLALDIAERDAMRQDDFRIGGTPWKIWDWEAKFWDDPIASRSIDDPIYKAPVDTTFAVYNKRFFDRDQPLQGVRVAGRFTCRHLPWYNDNGLPPDEEKFYRAHARDSFYLPPEGGDRDREVRCETPEGLPVRETPGAHGLEADASAPATREEPGVDPNAVPADRPAVSGPPRSAIRGLAKKVSALVTGRR